MQDHPSGNPDLVRQHKERQRIGDRELAQNSDQDDKRPVPGKGKPDAEEGVGTVQNQKR